MQALFNNRTLPLLEQVAIFAERRQDVLAGNIANASTPGYRSRDLPVAEFQNALTRAIQESRDPMSTGLVSPKPHAVRSEMLNELFSKDLFQSVERQPENLTFQDENNRSVEVEIMEMSKNSLLQNFAIELMTAQFQIMGAVISERP